MNSYKKGELAPKTGKYLVIDAIEKKPTDFQVLLVEGEPFPEVSIPYGLEWKGHRLPPTPKIHYFI